MWTWRRRVAQKPRSIPDPLNSMHLAETLRHAAERQPDMRLFTFLERDGGKTSVSAATLHHDACAVAALLAEQGVRPGHILPLVLEHGYDLVAAFWGAMYRGAIPAILPYTNTRSASAIYMEQVARVARFATAPTVATTEALRDQLATGLGSAVSRVVALPASSSLGSAWAPEPHFADPAAGPPYIQFSSGTTGDPKGVVLSNAAILEYMRVTVADLGLSDDEVAVGWLPLYHDMGLLNQLLKPVYFPHHSVMIRPADWLGEPQRLFHAVSEYRGTITWMPNFGFNYCVRRIRDEQIPGIDLSSWRTLGNASEPVRFEELEGFARRFAAFGLRRGAMTVAYGLAEHVAAVSWTRRGQAPGVDWIGLAGVETGTAAPAPPDAPGSRPVVSCGHPLPGVEVRIAAADGESLPERGIGEILLRGPCMFDGYYRMAEESAAALEDGWLHTGDLGYLAGGELYVCGRSKDLIIVGGRNIHPSHVEAVAASVLGEAGRLAAAFGVPNPGLGTESAVVVCEMAEVPDPAEIERLQYEVRERVRQAMQLYLADVHVVGRNWTVRTTSGKINRLASREKYLALQKPLGGVLRLEQKPRTAVQTESEPTVRRLTRIWEALFQRGHIDSDADFFELGGDSLLAMQFTLELEDEFHCVLPATALLQFPTISELAGLIERADRAVADDILVPLRTPAGTRQPPLFCVHGLGGGVLDYRALSRALGPDQPVYGLQCQGGAAAGADIGAMAERYVRRVKAFQPAGPYLLSGYCFGGLIAYEMARQLDAAGDRVALLAIIEGYAPSALAGRNRLLREWRFAVSFLRNLPYWFGDYVRLGRLNRRVRNRRLARVAKRRLLGLLGFERVSEGRDILDGYASLTAELQAMLEANVIAARNYSPGPYAGQIVLIRTARRINEAPQPDLGWGRLSALPVQIEMISGTHTNLLSEPHVQSLAVALRRFLSPQAESAPGVSLEASS